MPTMRTGKVNRFIVDAVCLDLFFGILRHNLQHMTPEKNPAEAGQVVTLRSSVSFPTVAVNNIVCFVYGAFAYIDDGLLATVLALRRLTRKRTYI